MFFNNSHLLGLSLPTPLPPFLRDSQPIEVDGLDEVEVPVRMLLPHEILDCLASSRAEAAFKSIMLGDLDDESRVRFWKHVKQLPPWASHPSLNVEEEDELSRLIGLHFHADGAQFYREDECFVWSVSSIFGGTGMIKDVLTFKFPFCIIPERHMRSKNAKSSAISYFNEVRAAAFKKVAEVAAWSMKFAASGQWPDKGFREESFPAKSFRAELCGRQLAQGWKQLGILLGNLFGEIFFRVSNSTQTTKNIIGICFAFTSYRAAQGLLLCFQS